MPWMYEITGKSTTTTPSTWVAGQITITFDFWHSSSPGTRITDTYTTTIEQKKTDAQYIAEFQDFINKRVGTLNRTRQVDLLVASEIGVDRTVPGELP